MVCILICNKNDILGDKAITPEGFLDISYNNVIHPQHSGRKQLPNVVAFTPYHIEMIHRYTEGTKVLSSRPVSSDDAVRSKNGGGKKKTPTKCCRSLHMDEVRQQSCCCRTGEVVAETGRNQGAVPLTCWSANKNGHRFIIPNDQKK